MSDWTYLNEGAMPCSQRLLEVICVDARVGVGMLQEPMSSFVVRANDIMRAPEPWMVLFNAGGYESAPYVGMLRDDEIRAWRYWLLSEDALANARGDNDQA